MKVGDYIKKLRTEKGLTQEELGEMLGVKRAAVNKWESGMVQNLKRTTIQKLAIIFNVNPATFIDGSENFESEKEKSSPNSNVTDILPSDNIYKIPVFSTVSAGFGACACSDIDEFIPVYISNPADVPDTIGIKVRGDSMYPKIEDGDIIIVRKQESVDSGSIAVMLLDGEEGLVKKVEYGRNWIDLISINPEYKTRRFENEEVLRLRVVGLVVGSYKKF